MWIPVFWRKWQILNEFLWGIGVHVVSLIECINLLPNFLWWLIHVLLLCPPNPINLIITQHSNLIGKTIKLFTCHNLNNFLLLFGIKILHTLTLFLLTYFTCYLLCIYLHCLHLLDFFILVFLCFWSSWMAVFGLWGCCWHVWGLNFVMFVFHVCV